MNGAGQEGPIAGGQVDTENRTLSVACNRDNQSRWLDEAASIVVGASLPCGQNGAVAETALLSVGKGNAGRFEKVGRGSTVHRKPAFHGGIARCRVPVGVTLG